MALALAAGLSGVVLARQAAESPVEPLHRPLDQLLDLYVRDGLVYYRALKSDRAR